MDFDTIFSRFLGELQAGKPDATLLTKEEMAAMTNMAINYSNRPTTANTPMVFRSRHPIAQFAKPFFSWKARQYSNLGNLFQWPLRSDRHRALVWITLITSVLIPMMLLGLANREFDEAGARVVAYTLWNQVRSSRHFWERDTLKSQALGALTASLSGVPFLDMAVTAALDDLPNRASLDRARR